VEVPLVTSAPEPERRPKSPHFFERQPDGSVRLRIRFREDEAAVIEEAAGDTPLLEYIHKVLNDRARYHIRKRSEVEGELDDAVDQED
jgi:hypothetical protein